MIVFGPLSSMSGILTFLTLRLGFHASATLLAAAGSSNRPSSSNSPSCLSRASAGPSTKANPGPALLLSSVAIAAITITLPYSPLAGPLGLTATVINQARPSSTRARVSPRYVAVGELRRLHRGHPV